MRPFSAPQKSYHPSGTLRTPFISLQNYNLLWQVVFLSFAGLAWVYREKFLPRYSICMIFVPGEKKIFHKPKRGEYIADFQDFPKDFGPGEYFFMYRPKVQVADILTNTLESYVHDPRC